MVKFKEMFFNRKSKNKCNLHNLITLVVILTIITLKISFLDSDTVSIINLHNEDEGNYVYNVRNFLVEGVFFKDETNFILLSPIYSLFVFIVVKILGISIFSFRLTSTVFGILAIIVGYIFLRKRQNKSIAVIFALLLATDFLFNTHSRIAMPEITVSFFFLFSFVTFVYAQKNNKLWIFYLSGLLSGLGFLVKSSAIVLFVTILAFIIFAEIYEIYRVKRIKISQIKYGIFNIIFAVIGFLTPIIFWYVFILKPNLKYFNLVYIGLVQLHKPQIRGQLMDPIFLRNEFNEFVIGGEGNIWIYLSPYFLAILIGIFYAVKKRTKFNKVFWFSFLWLLIGNVYFYILWYKPARWYIPNIIPLILITVFLISEIPKKIRLILIAFILLINLSLNFKYIYYKPTYYLKNASREIEKIVGNNLYAGDSLVLMENKYAKAFNPYFIQPVYTAITFDMFLNENNHPTYLVVGENQYKYEINKTNKYEYLKKFYSSNLQNYRSLSIYNLK